MWPLTEEEARLVRVSTGLLIARLVVLHPEEETPDYKQPTFALDEKGIEIRPKVVDIVHNKGAPIMPPSWRQVLRQVAESHSLSMGDLFKKNVTNNRRGNGAKIRRVRDNAISALVNMGISYARIGRLFGIDHTTVMYAVNANGMKDRRRERYAANAETIKEKRKKQRASNKLKGRSVDSVQPQQ